MGNPLLEYFPNKLCTAPDDPFFQENDSVSPENSRVFWKKGFFTPEQDDMIWQSLGGGKGE